MQITTIEAYPTEFHVYSLHFDRRWVTAIKTLPNSQWQRPRWIVPMHSTTLDQLRALFEPFGRVMINESAGQVITEEAMKGKYPFLYPFQAKVAAQAATTGAFLIAHEMGCGKTLSSLAAALEIKNNDPAIKSILVICPASIQAQWQREIKKWFGKPSTLIKGPALKRQGLWNLPDEIKIISYESFRQDFPRSLDDVVVIADELSKIKNKSKIHKVFIEMAKTTRYRIGASGTPISGRLEHYRNLMCWIKPGWMSWKFFDTNYAVKDWITIKGGERMLVTVGYDHVDDFVKRLNGFVDRKTKADVAPDLPPRTIEWRTVDMTSAQENLVDALMVYAKERGEGVLPIWQLLHTVSDGTEVTHESQSEILAALPMDAIPAEASPKLKEIEAILEEIGDEKVIIFTQFSRFARRIQSYLNTHMAKNIAVLVTGENSLDERDAIIRDFRANPETRVLVATDCLAMGISLSEINYQIQADLPADLSVFLQRADRIHRLDSTMPKTIIMLMATGLEEDIHEILDRKAVLNEQVLEGKAFDMVSIRDELSKKYGLIGGV